MGLKIIWRKEQLIKSTYDGNIRERKILGYPLEESPLKSYSNIFYWSHLVSEYGCTINDKALVGFEILTYVIKGKYETYNLGIDSWIELQEGDLEIIQGGKGTRYSEKFHPDTEVIKIWFDPGFDFHQRLNPLHTIYENKMLERRITANSESTIIQSKNQPDKFYTTQLDICIEQYKPGKHKITNSSDSVISGYIIEGYLDIRNYTLSYNDFFMIENEAEIPFTTLSDCKILLISSPLKPEYQTYKEMYAGY